MKTLFRNSRFCFFFFIVISWSFLAAPSLAHNQLYQDPVNLIIEQENLGPWRNGVSEDSVAVAPGPTNQESNSTLILAAKRTDRPDLLRRFKHYRGGWNITNRHYWTSVGFTGAAGFILAVLWFFFFGLVLIVHHCCKWRIDFKGKGSNKSQRLCLILLILFTCAAAIGCILLSVGQSKFHREAMHTLKYVVNQSDYTVETLRNVTEYLSLAKTITVAQVVLPTEALNDIDKLNIDLNAAADTLSQKTSENSGKIVKVFNAVRTALIVVAAVMLVLALLGFLLSILGHQHAIHIFVVSGWLLVVITFILCGVFMILNSAISDTCVAMNEWVENPHASTALSSILPCVDQGTTNKTLYQSKEIINDIVTVVNTYIYTFANANPSQNQFGYYNQSGPLMPPLCYPFDPQLQDRQCVSQEVSMENASVVWENYTCEVTSNGQCITIGRVTPDIYRQLVAAVNESYALQHYTPVLLSLQDCKFVRDTFEEITTNYCPPLRHDLRIVNAGLGMISVGALLCLVLWILYANRPQREEVFVTLPFSRKGRNRRDKRDEIEDNAESNAEMQDTNVV